MSSPIASCYPCEKLINESENESTTRTATNGLPLVKSEIKYFW